ncbi:MAG: RusA family crossover junction endodeoxyribonuclease [Bacteroidota bacterium]
MGKPRMTQRDRWKGRDVVKRYHAFCDTVRAQWPKTEAGPVPVPRALRVVFRLPVPKTQRKTTGEGAPHHEKPDVDNLVKALLDALMTEDKAIWRVDAQKVYTHGPGAITIEPLPHA